LQYCIGAFGPDERLGVFVPGLDEVEDIGLELIGTAMNAA